MLTFTAARDLNLKILQFLYDEPDMQFRFLTDLQAVHYPDRAAKVMGRVRELHGGKDYDAEWGKRFRGEGLWADLMARRFKVAVARLGMTAVLPPLRCDLFRPPGRAGDQLSLF